MLTYSKLSKRPLQFLSFTGLAVEEFDKLVEFVNGEYPDYEKNRLTRKNRIRKIGGGRKFILPLQERLLMLLIYYRLYSTTMLIGFLFDVDLSTVWRDIKHIEPIVKRCIPLPKKIHKRTKKIGTVEELLELFPEMEAFIDATEQEIPRPKNKRRRKSHYSGKKKKHTVKNQLLVNKKGLIIHKTKYSKGKKHDSKIYEENNPSVPPDVEKIGDLGYIGCDDIKTPRRKPRGKERPKADIRFNKKLAKKRIVVEHAIGRVKKFRVWGQEFRNRLTRHDTMTDIVSGLVNFRLLLAEGQDMEAFIG